MQNLILYKKGELSFVRFIKKRIKNNLNFLSIATGPTGSGKSWSMLRLAYEIDPTFEAKQVAFSFKQVMRLLNDPEFMKKKWKIIIFDECQIDISNRSWQSLVNRLFNYLLSTFRHRNIILLFTTPYSDFIDLSSKKLLHCEFVCKGWNKKTKKSRLRPKLLQYNSRMKKFYEHSLHVIRGGEVHKMENWEIDSPPEHIIGPYEASKLEFTDKLNERILKELENLDNEEKKPDTRKALTDKQEEVMELLSKYDPKEVSKQLSISLVATYKHKRAAEKKGYKIKEWKEIL